MTWPAGHGYGPRFGARPLRRAIQREADDRLFRMPRGLRSGQRITVGVRAGELDPAVEDPVGPRSAG